jgi:hypothetical protein
MWIYKVVLQGYASKDKRTMTFPLITDHATLELAQIDAGNIKSALAALTKANISKETLVYEISTDNQLPADESADCFEEVAISAYLNVQTVAEKLVTLSCPAPEDSIFQEDRVTMDAGNALAQAYVQAIGDLVKVSDNEQLQPDGRANGAIKGGWLRSKAKSFN